VLSPFPFLGQARLAPDLFSLFVTVVNCSSLRSPVALGMGAAFLFFYFANLGFYLGDLGFLRTCNSWYSVG